MRKTKYSNNNNSNAKQTKGYAISNYNYDYNNTNETKTNTGYYDNVDDGNDYYYQKSKYGNDQGYDYQSQPYSTYDNKKGKNQKKYGGYKNYDNMNELDDPYEAYSKHNNPDFKRSSQGTYDQNKQIVKSSQFVGDSVYQASNYDTKPQKKEESNYYTKKKNNSNKVSHQARVKELDSSKNQVDYEEYDNFTNKMENMNLRNENDEYMMDKDYYSKNIDYNYHQGGKNQKSNYNPKNKNYQQKNYNDSEKYNPKSNNKKKNQNKEYEQVAKQHKPNKFTNFKDNKTKKNDKKKNSSCSEISSNANDINEEDEIIDDNPQLQFGDMNNPMMVNPMNYMVRGPMPGFSFPQNQYMPFVPQSTQFPNQFIPQQQNFPVMDPRFIRGPPPQQQFMNFPQPQFQQQRMQFPQHQFQQGFPPQQQQQFQVQFMQNQNPMMQQSQIRPNFMPNMQQFNPMMQINPQIQQQLLQGNQHKNLVVPQSVQQQLQGQNDDSISSEDVKNHGLLSKNENQSELSHPSKNKPENIEFSNQFPLHPQMQIPNLMYQQQQGVPNFQYPMHQKMFPPQMHMNQIPFQQPNFRMQNPNQQLNKQDINQIIPQNMQFNPMQNFLSPHNLQQLQMPQMNQQFNDIDNNSSNLQSPDKALFQNKNILDSVNKHNQSSNLSVNSEENKNNLFVDEKLIQKHINNMNSHQIYDPNQMSMQMHMQKPFFFQNDHETNLPMNFQHIPFPQFSEAEVKEMEKFNNIELRENKEDGMDDYMNDKNYMFADETYKRKSQERLDVTAKEYIPKSKFFNKD